MLTVERKRRLREQLKHLGTARKVGEGSLELEVRQLIGIVAELLEEIGPTTHAEAVDDEMRRRP